MDNSTKKKIVASSAAYILGLNPQVKVSGTKNQKKVFKEVLTSSRNLYVILQEGNDSLFEEALKNKKKLAKDFSKEFGWSWPF